MVKSGKAWSDELLTQADVAAHIKANPECLLTAAEAAKEFPAGGCCEIQYEEPCGAM